MKYQLTTGEREERITRRRALAEAAAARVEELRAWRQERIAVAERRRVEARKAAEKAEKKARKKGKAPSHGVDRVPAGLTEGNPLQRPPQAAAPAVPAVKTKTRLRADEPPDLIAHASRSSWTPSRNRRPPRRRNMPGAVERRIERNRKAWTAQA